MATNGHFQAWLLIGWQNPASQSEAMLENSCSQAVLLAATFFSNDNPWQ